MLIQGDSVRIPLPDKSVHTCVTSPPYWGLRKYAGEQGRIWGGDPDCVHAWGDLLPNSKSNWKPGKTARVGNTLKSSTFAPQNHGQFCQLCNGWYGGLGLEPTPQLHIQNIVEIFAEVHRVLRDDGVVFLNYGDCFSSSPPGTLMKTWGDGSYARKQIRFESEDHIKDKRRTKTGIPQGNLMLMPHRIVIALQDWGWIVRNDLVWRKANPMPESQAGWRFERERKEKTRKSMAGKQPTNRGSMTSPEMTGGVDKVEWEYGEDYELRKGSWRHTRQHEYVFMLTKKMQYFANQEAVREKDIAGHSSGNDFKNRQGQAEFMPMSGGDGGNKWIKGSGRNPRSVLDVPLSELEKIALYTLEYAPWLIDEMVRDETNPADVLDVPTQPWKHAHYATYPANLIAPLIRATCPRWACPVCGQGWSPVVEKEKIPDELRNRDNDTKMSFKPTQVGGGQVIQNWRDANPPQIKEYRPTCEHPHTIEEAIPGTVFDPFVGSGTTVQVAKQLLRRGIGLDISMEYLDEQAKIRTGQGSPSNVLDDLPLFELIDK